MNSNESLSLVVNHPIDYLQQGIIRKLVAVHVNFYLICISLGSNLHMKNIYIGTTCLCSYHCHDCVRLDL
jgi:hypothetical protein